MPLVGSVGINILAVLCSHTLCMLQDFILLSCLAVSFGEDLYGNGGGSRPRDIYDPHNLACHYPF